MHYIQHRSSLWSNFLPRGCWSHGIISTLQIRIFFDLALQNWKFTHFFLHI